jgi:acyl carrier protein phosphodiesterase
LAIPEETALNYLAHALLAGEDPALLVGGVIGDWIKGTLPGVLPEDIATGVALHRAIDNFAESQPAFRRSRLRVSVGRRRYAGVLVDVFYDHILARNWAAIHHRSLDQYCEIVYRLIEDRLSELPITLHSGLKLMAKENWLSSYAQIEGVADILARMSHRARQPNPLKYGEEEFLADVAGFTSDFYEWLDGMRRFCQQWKSGWTTALSADR